MADVHSAEQRSYNMSRIRSKDSKPELIVRSLVHRMGYRFRLHVAGLPGTPDLVLPVHHRIIFVHGCFWHRHHCRYGRVKPATNIDFWIAKRLANSDRDRRNRRRLKAAGWSVLVVWECWMKDIEGRLLPKLRDFLSGATVRKLQGQTVQNPRMQPAGPGFADADLLSGVLD